MPLLAKLIDLIDSFTECCGRLLAWLAVAMMLVMSAVVVLRYGFSWSSVALQESITYLHASLFMLGFAYTLKVGGHVRVDIFYRNFTARQQAWVNSLGGIIFLLPLCVFVIAISADLIAQSWAIREVSTEPGGIPAVFLLKSLIPLMAVLLFLQGLAEVLRNCLLLTLSTEHSDD